MSLPNPGMSFSPLTELPAAELNDIVENIEALSAGTGLATGVIEQTNLKEKLTDYSFDFVASGCVWSGDAYGSTRAASMTVGVVYIAGVRVPVSVVTARTFTASRDTYIDVGADGVVDYNEVSNNAASPALAASHIRIGIIVTGASNIANVGSVNQGQEDKVLPIASSVPYQVTDSLGNLICSRDSSRTLLGLKQRTVTIGNFTTASASAVQIPELSIPIIVPTGRKIKVCVYARQASNSTAATYAIVAPFIGTVGAGTALPQSISYSAASASSNGIQYDSSPFTPTSTNITINIGALAAGGGTATLQALSGSPIIAWVELA